MGFINVSLGKQTTLIISHLAVVGQTGRYSLFREDSLLRELRDAISVLAEKLLRSLRFQVIDLTL